MAQLLEALDVLPEDQSLVPSTNMAAHNHLELELLGIWCLLLASVGTPTHE